ncbi:glycosyltransferase [Thiohalocapsa marina]|uniref:glycosyltransferase n=1 Tax=Thiohalocapsa marina TaxID=424902 RepID=UPI0036DAFA48
MRIAVYAISKNEGKFVERFCASAKDADLVLIADTGSTDATVELAEAFGAAVYDITITPFRFDLARNAALALVPRDIDVCVSLDLDEVLEPGWRAEIERVWELGKTTRLRYGFDWGQGIQFQYEKIHARHGYRWHHAVHEYPRPDARITEVYAHTDRLLVRHLPDPTKSRGQYLDLLKLAVTEDPRCPRNAFYYARELTFYRRWLDAIDALGRYLAMPEADWPNERCYAMRLLGKAHDELGRGVEAMRWYRRATAEAPGTREPWCDLAMACYRRSLWAECYAAATSALAIKDKALVYTMDPAVWGALPHDLAAIAAWNLGLPDAALTHGRQAAALAPGDERIVRNLAHYEQRLQEEVEA